MRLRARFVMLACVVALAGCGRNVLYAGLSEQQANEVQAALLASDIAAEKRGNDDGKTWTVHIDTGDVPQALQVLRAHGLPREHFSSMGEVFKKEGFVSSPVEERARYVYALSQELSDTLSRIDGVIDARVQIAMPESHPLLAEEREASASVVIIEAEGSNLRERQTDIQAIVTDGVEGLDDPNRVTVKFFTRSPPEVSVATTVPKAGVQQLLSGGNAVYVLTTVVLLMLASLVVLAWSNRSLLRRLFGRTGGGRQLREPQA